MRPETLQEELAKILESSFPRSTENQTEELCLSETEMFQLWNFLGEELGIDLSLATSDQRKLLFDACENGRKLSPRAFGSLLWLVYYGDLM
ncbi:MAG: hypothetical protein FJY29_11935 [Betaproteobacteria bacterium]|nr:hypothetical protein [Betaproteobacteria bacterium]